MPTVDLPPGLRARIVKNNRLASIRAAHTRKVYLIDSKSQEHARAITNRALLVALTKDSSQGSRMTSLHQRMCGSTGESTRPDELKRGMKDRRA